MRERAQALIRASVDDINDPFSLARLDGDELAGEPTRLVEEANTIPLFGGRRAVWVKVGSRNIVPAVEALLARRLARLPGRDRGRRPAPQRAAARAHASAPRTPRRCPATRTTRRRSTA